MPGANGSSFRFSAAATGIGNALPTATAVAAPVVSLMKSLRWSACGWWTG